MRASLLATLGLLLFLVTWEASGRLGWVDAIFLPPPTHIWPAFLREWQLGIWGQSLRDSLTHYAVGLVVGASIGLVFGVLAGLFVWLDDALRYVTRLLRPIPGLAWVPFAILWFGATPQAAVFIIAVAVFWILFFAAHGAVRLVDRDLLEVADAFGYRSRMAKLTRIILPAAMPGIFVGLRTAIGQAWMAVVAAELFGVHGLGQRMMQASSLLSSDVVVVYMLTMAAVYGLLDTLFLVVQKRWLSWKV